MWRERFGSSGVAAAVDGSSGAGPAVGDQSEGRACVRAGAQIWRAHLRGHQRGRGGRASGRWRTLFEFTPPEEDEEEGEEEDADEQPQPPAKKKNKGGKRAP